jgi:hypothetical protein
VEEALSFHPNRWYDGRRCRSGIELAETDSTGLRRE